MTKGLALLLSFLLFIATSCMGSSDLEVYAEENINIVRVAGSTTVSPLMQSLMVRRTSLLRAYSLWP